MQDPGEKLSKLINIRMGTAYPRLRKSVSATRTIAFVLIILLVIAAVLSILGMIFIASSADNPGPTLQMLLGLALSTLIWAGTVYLVSELGCGAIEVLVDLGDQVIDKSAGQAVAQEQVAEIPAASPESEQLAGRLFDRAVQAARTGDKEEATRLLRSVVELYPGTAAARKAELSIKRR